MGNIFYRGAEIDEGYEQETGIVEADNIETSRTINAEVGETKPENNNAQGDGDILLEKILKIIQREQQSALKYSARAKTAEINTLDMPNTFTVTIRGCDGQISIDVYRSGNFYVAVIHKGYYDGRQRPDTDNIIRYTILCSTWDPASTEDGALDEVIIDIFTTYMANNNSGYNGDNPTKLTINTVMRPNNYLSRDVIIPLNRLTYNRDLAMTTLKNIGAMFMDVYRHNPCSYKLGSFRMDLDAEVIGIHIGFSPRMVAYTCRGDGLANCTQISIVSVQDRVLISQGDKMKLLLTANTITRERVIEIQKFLHP